MDILDRRYVKIEMNNYQRELFRSAMGRQVNSVLVDTKTGVAFPEEIECMRCLMSTRFNYNISISENGLCNLCEEYSSHRTTERGEAWVRRFLENGNDNRTVIAFSGGKDSAVCLVIAVKEFGLKPTVILVDNGFIPESIIKRAKRLCNSLDVPLKIRKIDITRRVRDSILNYFMRPAPCQICITKVFEVVSDVCRQLNITKVIGGHRYPPLIYTLDGFTGRRQDRDISCISLLMAKDISEKEQLALLSDYKFNEEEIQGNSTNCILLGYVENIFYNRYGFSPHVEEVSREIRAGFITREEGLDKIKRPVVSNELKAEISQRLSINLH